VYQVKIWLRILKTSENYQAYLHTLNAQLHILNFILASLPQKTETVKELAVTKHKQ